MLDYCQQKLKKPCRGSIARSIGMLAIFSVYEHVMSSGGGFLLDDGRFREPIYSGELEMLGDLELDELDLLLFPAIVLVDFLLLTDPSLI